MSDPNQLPNVQDTPPTHAVANSYPHQKQVDGAMRGTAALAGYGALGINMLEMPGVSPKLVGAAMVLTGLREQYVGIKGNEDSQKPMLVNLRARVSSLGESLIAKSKGKSGIGATVKHDLGIELVDSKDKVFRTCFARVMGGSALLMSGVEFMSQPSTAEKVMGSVLAATGYFEQTHNLLRSQDRAQELADQRRSNEPPVQYSGI